MRELWSATGHERDLASSGEIQSGSASWSLAGLAGFLIIAIIVIYISPDLRRESAATGV
jgi:hypothetical protein